MDGPSFVSIVESVQFVAMTPAFCSSWVATPCCDAAEDKGLESAINTSEMTSLFPIGNNHGMLRP